MGSAQYPPIFPLTGANGVVVKDTSGSAEIDGNVANSGTNAGVILNNAVALTGSTKIASFQNAGVEKAYIDNAGTVVVPSAAGGLLSAGTLQIRSAVNGLINIGDANANAIMVNNQGNGTGGNATLGYPSSTARSGIRIGASRVIATSKPTAPVDIAGGVTATVTQMLECGIFLCSASATLTLPTMQGAAGLVQALPGTPIVGDIITFVQVVAAAQTATLAAGTGSTLGGVATTTATGRVWIGRITAVTANSETVTWY